MRKVTLVFLFISALFLSVTHSAEKIKAENQVEDALIEARINKILKASKKFETIQVEVEEGIVHLDGVAAREEDKKLAAKIAQRVEGVIFAYNDIEVDAPQKILDWSLLENEIEKLKESFWSVLPRFLFATIIIFFGYLLTKLAGRLLFPFYNKKFTNSFLANLSTKVSLLPIIVVVLYLSLQITGLTRLAITVLTGTGLIGLALGIAFRNIAENFFASILLSVQRPYEIGDLVEIAGHLGYVNQLTSRGTALITLEGNHVQIPNSLAYSESLVNFTANKNMRVGFTVGIGYNDKISHAQEVALEVLKNHPSVLKNPKPLILVEGLEASTIKLGVYLWLDTSKYSQFKVKSSAIRLVKGAFDRAGISMPDEAREIIFPQGVPVRNLKQDDSSLTSSADQGGKVNEGQEVAAEGEGQLQSEFEDIEDQAKHSRKLEGGENLLKN